MNGWIDSNCAWAIAALEQNREVVAVGEGQQVVQVGADGFRRRWHVERAARGVVAAADPVLDVAHPARRLALPRLVAHQRGMGAEHGVEPQGATVGDACDQQVERRGGATMEVAEVLLRLPCRARA